MSRYFRGDTGQVWNDFDALRQQALTTLGSIDRMLSRLATNQMPITLGMLSEFQETINAQKVWWANLKEQQVGHRPFRIVSAATSFERACPEDTND